MNFGQERLKNHIGKINQAIKTAVLSTLCFDIFFLFSFCGKGIQRERIHSFCKIVGMKQRLERLKTFGGNSKQIKIQKF